MPQCPECEYTASASNDWFQGVFSNDKAYKELVVCPGCDTVLGGVGAAWGEVFI